MKRDEPVRAFVFDVGAVSAAWAVLVAIENFVVGLAYRSEIVASWEMSHARLYLSPIALGASFPLAVGAVVVARLVAARRANETATLAAVAGAAMALGVSTGRHFESWAMRGPFVVVVAAVAALGARTIVRRMPTRPRAIAGCGVAVACAAWLGDALVLPRLYPAFHTALLVITLGAWATTVLFVTDVRVRRGASVAGLLLVALSLAWTSHAARAIRGDDNMRRVMLEHAPMLGRAVVVAARIEPPPPIPDEDAALTAATLAVTSSHALDWRGRDIVLVTIDALRADHVGAYGYARATTPAIDRLAARGARFTHAYCPTPHTSYSVASMMVGKYMRPLLAMNAGEGSETWPSYLRRYGWRTAAFYPPAVFFIDEHRFRAMRDNGLGFEYRKVEFAKPELRREQIERYLAAAKADKPLFLWIHLFEPHEPYEMHPEHPFSGDERTDAYDSEIATADALVGDVVAAVEKRRPGAVFVVSADHGEELGDHGGHYHGTTVYEEQVRVPLVVVGPGIAPRTIDVPVQTIDLLPTTLAALDIPLPARLRGRDLGGLLAGRPPSDEGLAFAETDDWTMIARGADRLVCARKIASCTLFDVAKDPGEHHPITDRPARVAELSRITAAVERENGRIEQAALPDALRRCMQGDRDAAFDIAPLLDDARVDIRRAAARCAFGLRANEIAPQLRRAMSGDEDADVRAWSALAVVRASPVVLPDDAARLDALRGDERTAAALVFAEHGDARGESDLVARWEAAFAPDARTPGELDEARDLLAALAKIRARSATLPLARSLEEVRLRPYVVDALATIGDARAKPPLLDVFTNERYVNVREAEARALLGLGARAELYAPLARFAGVPEPMTSSIAIARDAGLLRPDRGGLANARPLPTHMNGAVRISEDAPVRLLVLGGSGAGELEVLVDGAKVSAKRADDLTFIADLGPRRAGPVVLDLAHEGGIAAAWIVPLAAEIPPPPPRQWDAGPEAPFGLESAP
jgi:arylsulfatase A-like enzyme